jgi:hypothetical protein
MLGLQVAVQEAFMPDNEARSREDEYFWKKDQELIEKMRQKAAAEQANREMGAKAGLDDPEMIQELQALGFTPESVVLLPLMPLVQIAWAEGGVSDAERQLIVKLARSRGVVEGSTTDGQLSAWLTNQPDPQVFARATRLIRAMLASPGAASSGLTADDLVAYCENIAAASGGVFGMKRISSEERALLSSIAAGLKARDA